MNMVCRSIQLWSKLRQRGGHSMFARALRHLPLLLVLCAGLGLLLYGPIAQPERYNEFADRRALFGVRNGADVLSSAGFAIVGLWGLARLWPARMHRALSTAWPGYCLFLVALVLVAAGSTFYHLAPDNGRLIPPQRARVRPGTGSSRAR